jgi:integrase
MARRPKPWYWKERKAWYVTINTVRHNLGPDKTTAYKAFHNLMTKPDVIIRGSVAEVLEKFMDWTEKNRPRSYDWYKKRLDRFYPIISNLFLGELRPLHIQEELDKHDWSEAYKAGCVTALKRVFNWSLKQGYIDRNPLLGLTKPEAGRREQILTQEQFDTALSQVPNQNFKDIVSFIWYTGCRPEEAVKIDPSMVQGDKIVIPRPEAKKKKKPRVIYLCPEAKEIVERNIDNSPLFLNTQGRPWTAYAIACTWGRIEKKTGVRYCSYALRHSYATHKLQSGTDAVTVATLLGHQDTSMLAKVYANLEDQYLLANAGRNACSGPVEPKQASEKKPGRKRGKRERPPR